MGSVNLVPIGDANLKVQDKARVPGFSDDRTCHPLPGRRSALQICREGAFVLQFVFVLLLRLCG